MLKRGVTRSLEIIAFVPIHVLLVACLNVHVFRSPIL